MYCQAGLASWYIKYSCTLPTGIVAASLPYGLPATHGLHKVQCLLVCTIHVILVAAASSAAGKPAPWQLS